MTRSLLLGHFNAARRANKGEEWALLMIYTMPFFIFRGKTEWRG